MGLSSFFGRKQDKSGKKDEKENKVAAPRIVTPQRSAAPPPPLPEEPAVVESPPAPEADAGLDAPPPREELPELDFNGSGVPGYAPDVDDESMQIHEGSSRVHPIVEEIAILYANGGVEAAQQTAEAAIQRPDLGAATEQVWAMLFELYQILGRQEEFEQCAYEYLLRFEKSPPSWSAGGEEAAAGSGAAPVCNLSGALSAASSKQFEQMQRIVAKNPHVQLDVAKVSSADADGCAQLIELLESARKQKRSVAVRNSESLVALLQEKVSIGQRENEPLWRLLLELLQQQGHQETFEEWALNFAITFEVSPPSWDPKAVAAPPRKPKAPQRPVRAEGGEIFALSGEMIGANASEFASLAHFAEPHDPVVIDLGHLQRIDFVCAGMLLNTLSQLAIRGKTLRMVNASPLVAALFGAMGISQIAEIVRRRS